MNLKILLMALLVLALPVMAACGGDDDDDGGDGKLESLTLMLDWTPNAHHAGIYVAQQKGYYKDAGLDVKIVEPAAGGVEQVVANGDAQIGISIQEAVIPARAEGIPVVSIGTIIQHNLSSLMSLPSDNIQRPKDLAGKTYGGFGGALETALIKQLVACDGGDANSIKFIEVGDIDYLAGLEQNRFDFVWVFESWDVMRAREVEGKQVNSVKFIDHLNCIPDWYTPLFISGEKMLKDHPDTVRKFMEATAKGYQEAMANPKAAADALLAGAPELDRKLVEKSTEYMSTHFVDKGQQWGLQDLAVWQKFEKFLRDTGLTEKEVDVKPAFTNDYLPKK